MTSTSCPEVGGLAPVRGVFFAVSIPFHTKLPVLMYGAILRIGLLFGDESREWLNWLATFLEGCEDHLASIGEVQPRHDVPGFVVLVRNPIDDIHTCCLACVGNDFQGADHGWMRFDDPIGPLDCYLQRLCELLGCPWFDSQRGIPPPWFGVQDDFHEKVDRLSALCKGAERCGDRIFAVHGMPHSFERNAFAGWLEAVDTAIARRSSHATSNISSETLLESAYVRQR